MKPHSMPLALACVALFALLSAAPQWAGLAAIGTAPPVGLSARILAQAILFVPIFFLLAFAGKDKASKGLFIFLVCFAVVYAHFPSPFFDYIWDVFLIEAIFVCLSSGIFLTRPKWHKYFPWPMRLLLFKLMFCMGVVKFLHGMPEWRTGLAMKYFWANQPMPGFLAWYAAQLPDWAQRALTLYTFIVEIPGPFLIFGGSKLRKFYFYATALLQCGIFLTGNYGFFNILTIVISLSLLDFRISAVAAKPIRRTWGVVLFVTLAGWFTCSIWYIYRAILPGEKYLHETSWILLKNAEQAEVPAPIRVALQLYAAAKVSNPYALFGMIPKYRMEIVVETSADNQTWQKLDFRVRPNKPEKAPISYAPHHWRLDHQMYYESFRIRAPGMQKQYSFFLGTPWIHGWMRETFLKNQEVSELLAQPADRAGSQKFLRFQYVYYEFNSREEQLRSGNYWRVITARRGKFPEQIFTLETLDEFP